MGHRVRIPRSMSLVYPAEDTVIVPGTQESVHTYDGYVAQAETVATGNNRRMDLSENIAPPSLWQDEARIAAKVIPIKFGHTGNWPRAGLQLPPPPPPSSPPPPPATPPSPPATPPPPPATRLLPPVTSPLPPAPLPSPMPPPPPPGGHPLSPPPLSSAPDPLPSASPTSSIGSSPQNNSGTESSSSTAQSLTSGSTLTDSSAMITGSASQLAIPSPASTDASLGNTLSSASTSSKHTTVIAGVLVPVLIIVFVVAIILHRRARRHTLDIERKPCQLPNAPTSDPPGATPRKKCSHGGSSPGAFEQNSSSGPATILHNVGVLASSLSRTQTSRSSEWPETPLPRYVRPLPHLPPPHESSLFIGTVHQMDSAQAAEVCVNQNEVRFITQLILVGGPGTIVSLKVGILGTWVGETCAEDSQELPPSAQTHARKSRRPEDTVEGARSVQGGADNGSSGVGSHGNVTARCFHIPSERHEEHSVGAGRRACLRLSWSNEPLPVIDGFHQIERESHPIAHS
ncbi:hypothetical protein K438DRAFT_2178349 [Mycena galopus ATCC 62051]|nr:hypothetical protein K438DRAFT_2178349 [Mycena galopus ATCC 62051]